MSATPGLIQVGRGEIYAIGLLFVRIPQWGARRVGAAGLLGVGAVNVDAFIQFVNQGEGAGGEI